MTGPCCCGATDGVRLYACGWRCPEHTPARQAGRPEPGEGRYCAPFRCYCGDCPSWTPDTSHYVGETVVDIRAVASGKRRASLTEYRNAQANTPRGAA
jgi:hypothetical protein